ncbi:MAG: hypothetical protein HQM08_26690 [Candidatus Riflebacteria bacterium]|nr:hypothetical protein [Candidatus Riflebacteria bacterium]
MNSAALKPLLIVCQPESNALPQFDFLFSCKDLTGWEAAISRSAAEIGLLGQLSPILPIFLEFESNQLFEKLKLFDIVVVYPLSLNTLAKFSLGIRDSFPSSLLGKAIEIGIPILLDQTPLTNRSFFNPHLEKIYKQHWDSIRTGTISSFSQEDLSESVKKIIRSKRQLEGRPPSNGRKIITRDDVLEAFNALVPINVKPGTIITDLAREEAETLGVRIEFEY